MIELFNTVLFEPIFNLLMVVYHYLPPHDLGISIIVVTLVLKLLLYLPSLSSIRSQQAMQEIQPKLDALRKKYEKNKEELSRQLVSFYKENKISPFSSCLPLLIQFPILLALFRVFIAVSGTDADTGILPAEQLEHLYGTFKETYASTPIDTTLLGFVDLAQTKNYIMAGLAAGLQFWQSRMMMKRNKKTATKNIAQSMSQQMIYLMPVMTFIFGVTFPAGLTLYWATSTLFQVAQQYMFIRLQKKDKETSTGDREQTVN
ncbi:YidC/Oxa1 family membrane protein insertase [Patescibacteria group bacterium]|nr:YidC/Oxa1 family membrane protein insertase [Patescibacteria group bacterium]MBU1890962.1 YidC/Oxa1 family membrane protein insertase [Patescibacteria group bacterium]